MCTIYTICRAGGEVESWRQESHREKDWVESLTVRSASNDPLLKRRFAVLHYCTLFPFMLHTVFPRSEATATNFLTSHERR